MRVACAPAGRPTHSRRSGQSMPVWLHSCAAVPLTNAPSRKGVGQPDIFTRNSASRDLGCRGAAAHKKGGVSVSYGWSASGQHARRPCAAASRYCPSGLCASGSSPAAAERAAAYVRAAARAGREWLMSRPAADQRVGQAGGTVHAVHMELLAGPSRSPAAMCAQDLLGSTHPRVHATAGLQYGPSPLALTAAAAKL